MFPTTRGERDERTEEADGRRHGAAGLCRADAGIVPGLRVRAGEALPALSRPARRREIEAYLLHLLNNKKLAYASVNQVVCVIRFLFAAVLGKKDIALDIPMAKVLKRPLQLFTHRVAISNEHIVGIKDGQVAFLDHFRCGG